MRLLLSSACAVMLFAGTAGAVEVKQNGAYAGVALGTTSLDNNTFDDLGRIPGVQTDDDDTGFQLWGGYKFFNWFAVEGRLAGLGEYTSEAREGAAFANLKAEAAALTGNAVFILPFGQSGWELYGQVGLGIVSYDLSLSTNAFGPVVSEDEDGTEAVGTAGAGVRWTPIPALTLSLGLDAWATEIEDEDFNITMGRFGAQYNF